MSYCRCPDEFTVSASPAPAATLQAPLPSSALLVAAAAGGRRRRAERPALHSLRRSSMESYKHWTRWRHAGGPAEIQLRRLTVFSRNITANYSVQSLSDRPTILMPGAKLLVSNVTLRWYRSAAEAINNCWSRLWYNWVRVKRNLTDTRSAISSDRSNNSSKWNLVSDSTIFGRQADWEI